MPLTWSALTLADVPILTALVNSAIEADGTGRPIGAASVAEEFQAPRFDPVTDSIAVWDGDALVAEGRVWTPAEPVDGRALVSVAGNVHLAHRGRGIGRDLLTWLEGRAIGLAHERHPGLPVRLRSPGGTPDSSTQRLLEIADYRPDN